MDGEGHGTGTAYAHQASCSKTLEDMLPLMQVRQPKSQAKHSLYMVQIGSHSHQGEGLSAQATSSLATRQTITA